jgi:hypothetical protein
MQLSFLPSSDKKKMSGQKKLVLQTFLRAKLYGIEIRFSVPLESRADEHFF